MRSYQSEGLFTLADSLILVVPIILGLFCRFDGATHATFTNIYIHSIALLISISIAVFFFYGVHNRLAKYESIDELIQISFAVAIGSYISYANVLISNNLLPKSVYIISWLIMFSLVRGTRIPYGKMALKKIDKTAKDAGKTVMVVGSGETGAMVLKELRRYSTVGCRPVIFVDDDVKKRSVVIDGVPVKGNRYKIKLLAEKYKVDEIIVALPLADKVEISDVLHRCKTTKCHLKILPAIYEPAGKKISFDDLRDVRIEDLLGREEVRLDIDGIVGYIQDEIILVTGGGGSIGSELCRQVAKYKPKELIILDLHENNANDIRDELLRTYKNQLSLKVIITSVKDRQRLEEIFKAHKPRVVFHAAAHKHIPLMELNPAEAIKDNIIGTLNVAQCAHDFGAKRFVLLSTDKAASPTSIIDVTKRVAEMIIQSLGKVSKTKFVAVRFSNTLDDNESFIPLFQKQIEQGGPVTVPHPKIARYFMTKSEAAQMAIQAGAITKGGEVLLLDTRECVKVDDVARDLIRLSGFVPDVDIKIEYTGLHLGEKLYDDHLLEEDAIKITSHPNIFSAKPLELSFSEIFLNVNSLKNSLNSHEQFRKCMKHMVPTCAYVNRFEEVALAQEDTRWNLVDKYAEENTISAYLSDNIV